MRTFFAQSRGKFAVKMFGEILLVLFPQEMQLKRAQHLSRDIFRNSFRECKIRISREFSLCGSSSLTTCHKRKWKFALHFLECCAAEVALQHSLLCSAEVICTKSCAAASEKLHCNIDKAALQESGAFLPLSCGFQAPTFRHPRLGPADA